jgi:CRP-like cAMP-binding protein
MADQQTQSLGGIALFAALTDEERARIARACRWRRFAAGEQILDRHDDSRDVCFIASGRVRIVNFSLSGREVSFDDLNAGQFFGELAAIDGEPRSASVIALEPTSIAFAPSGVFQDIVSGHPELARAVFQRLARMVRLATDRIMDLTTLGANNRVHAEILRLAKPSLKDDGTAVIKPIPVHSDIASRVSTTRETVARVFGELARDGILKRQSDHLLVADYEALEELVENVRN